MSKHNSKVLKVYQQCQNVLKLKRKFLEQIQLPILPILQNSKQISKVKDYCTVHYIQIAVVNFFQQARENYALYKNQVFSKKAIQIQIQSNVKKIKNTKDLTSRHEQLQHELQELKKNWVKEEPFIYYEINERLKFKNLFKQNFNQFKESQTGIKTIKNPHFVHKLINELKQNLQKISLEDKSYDLESEQNTQKIGKCLLDLTKQMEINIESIKYRNFIFQQKKKLFSQFIDAKDFMGRSELKQSNIARNYFEELILVSKDIKDHFKQLLLLVDQLIKYFREIYLILKKQVGNLEKKYMKFIQQVFLNKEIRVILRIDIEERINNNLKTIFSISQIIKTFPATLQTYRSSLIECYNEANNYNERYISRQAKFKVITDSFEKMLIEHKGYFSSLQKSKDLYDLEQEKQNEMNILNLRKFVQQLYELMKSIYQDNLKHSKIRIDLSIHETINKIFAEYNFAEEKNELSESSSTSDSKDLNLQAKIKQFEKFINSIQIFDFSSVNWSNSYYSCSLGPKLLIHGYLQIIDSGIYYESSFNKKNYFFGKTRIFIPKSDIYEINKQIAFFIFPDVIQVKTNKGEIYFHALGKRDRIYEQLIYTYFPEVQQTENPTNGELQMDFNEFRGQDVTGRTAFKIKPYALDFSQSVIKNSDLRVIFRRYFSDDSFTYQGKLYQNFKCYQLEHVGGLNPSSNQLTPPPPYYFCKKGEPNVSEAVPDYSIRMASFQKKIPLIPFISKGGKALCQQKSTYYWGDPDLFVIDILSTMKGFKLTEGMTIKLRIMFSQDRQKNEVKCSSTGEIQFSSEGALTGTIKNQALAQTKVVIKKTIQAIKKNEKNRSVYKNKGNKITQENYQFLSEKDEVEKLKLQNLQLKRFLKILVTLFFSIYIFTIFWFCLPQNCVQSQNASISKLQENEDKQIWLNWQFW